MGHDCTAYRAAGQVFPDRRARLVVDATRNCGWIADRLIALTHGLMVDLSTDIAALVAASADPDMRYVIGSPSQLATLIKAMDLVDARAPYICACLVMGGAVSPHLKQAAARIFGGSVMAHMGLPNLAPVRAMWPRSSLRTATGLKF